MATDALDTVRKALTALGIPEETVTATARLRGDLELDSTELVEVSLEIQRSTGKEVKLELADDLTVSDVCELVDKAQPAAA
ncbi:phosphopantetheine-binding protein [Streptomyces tubbatahanensis]|uniref:Phosphopantetheine-binding protein n=1 Tax=Streptomyces tubbatahanensis TaxID=2923272 RepID=A0ABY3XXI2_9ACTN|nr:phosphopantetheine-binding protein [Streptomyces tubbatahanensis]UNS99084.1 phosphopantetheine-binding protein [Streptomyces tubbatahanensis]